MGEPLLLSSKQMAEFAARGCLRMDAVVPEEINQQFLDDIGHVHEDEIGSMSEHYAKVMATSAVPVVNAGTALKDAYPEGSALRKLINLPLVKGGTAVARRRPLGVR